MQCVTQGTLYVVTSMYMNFERDDLENKAKNVQKSQPNFACLNYDLNININTGKGGLWYLRLHPVPGRLLRRLRRAAAAALELLRQQVLRKSEFNEPRRHHTDGEDEHAQLQDEVWAAGVPRILKSHWHWVHYLWWFFWFGLTTFVMLAVLISV